MKRRLRVAATLLAGALLSLAWSAQAGAAALTIEVPATAPLIQPITATFSGTVEAERTVFARLKPGDVNCGPSIGADITSDPAGSLIIGGPRVGPPSFRAEGLLTSDERPLPPGLTTVCAWLQENSTGTPDDPPADAVGKATLTLVDAPPPNPPQPPPPPPPPAAALTAAAVRPSTLAAARRGSTFTKRGRARLRFSLNVAAKVGIAIERRRGRRWRKLKGSLTRSLPAGATTLRFTGRWRNRRLARGRYRLVLRPSAPSGAGPAVRVRFRIR